MLNKNVVIPRAQFTRTVITQNNRNIGLDVARAVCAVIVVISHTNNYMGQFTGAYRYIFPVGYMIQDLFFGLSGFLVGSQIVRQISKGGTVRNLLVFYRNRWVRTIPFYLIFLGINYLMFCSVYQHSKLNFFNSDFRPGEYVVFMQSFAKPHPAFFPEIWPLPIEEWSFLCLPIPVLVLTQVLKKPLSEKQLIALLLLELLLTNYIRIHHILHNDLQTDWGLRKIVLYRFDALIYGFLLSVLMDRFREFFKKYQLLFLLISFPICYGLYFSNSFMNIRLYQSLLFFVFPLLMSATVPFFYFHSFQFLKSGLRAMLTHISLISYSVLLSHLYLIQFFMLTVYKPAGFMQGLVFTLIYFTFLLLFATVFFNRVERPILMLRKKRNSAA